VNGEIAGALQGARAAEQSALDRTMIELDGTPNKGRLGANAILGVLPRDREGRSRRLGQPLYEYFGELYAATGARDAGKTTVLPVPMMNVLNGGRTRRQQGGLPGVHGGPRRSGELLGVPPGPARRCSRRIKATLHEHGLSTAGGDEGGFAPDLGRTRRLSTS